MLIAILIFIALVFFLVERHWPGSKLPDVKGWWWRIAWINVMQALLVVLAGATWDRWFAARSLFHLTEQVGVWPSAIIAYVVSTLVYYFWHRYRHESDFFWRVCHQLHHSASRIEVLTSFYKHPVEIFCNSLLSAFLVYLVLGCDFRAGVIYTAFTAIAEYFYHWNIRTPRWVGWLIQRPESHRVHHQRNRHTGNYADLPIWDLLFGTFHNPRSNPRQCGFSPEREAQIKEIMLFQDVHAPNGTAPICVGCKKRSVCQLRKSEQQPHETTI